MSDVVAVAAISTGGLIVVAWIQSRGTAKNRAAIHSVGDEVKQVHGEVKTMNGLQLGQLADAAETRRVEAIPIDERTAAEAEHVEVVPPPGDTPAN